ncbi:HD domain protein [Raphanus sativus]|nr:HD domain protein [Raphanus sativus]
MPTYVSHFSEISISKTLCFPSVSYSQIVVAGVEFRQRLPEKKSAPSSKSHSLAHPQIFHRSAAAAASSPNRANHCMAKDSPLSQPDRSGDGSVSLPPPPSASSAIDFLSLSSRLKTTPRAGWVKRELKNPESIVDQMYGMGLMALVSSDIPGFNRDRDKCMKVAIVHDIAEAILGDITPTCGISKEEKKVKHFNTCANSWVEEKELKKSLSCGENMKQTNHQKPRLLKISISLR